jgi:hypothetical protein
VPQLIAVIYSAAAEPQRSAAEMEQAIDAFHLEVDLVTLLAREHRSAIDQAADLENRN